MAPHHIVSEVDRYLAAPGQASAYMVGRLEIQRLRRRVEADLGNRFDVRDFHEAVLAEGPVPLSLLDELITEWIASQAASLVRLPHDVTAIGFGHGDPLTAPDVFRAFTTSVRPGPPRRR
jgi:hypothetical protein